MRRGPTTLPPEDAEAIAGVVLKFLEIVIEAVVRRVVSRMTAQSRTTEKPGPRLLTYAEAGERIGRTAQAVKAMVKRKELKSVHPMGGRRVYIHPRDLEQYIEWGRIGRSKS